jgi:SAM-dependent methyltransferase
MDNTSRPSKESLDLFWLHIRDLPYFRALLRSIEARFYQEIHLPEPVLDLGCGDGHFSSVAFNSPLKVGLDPWESSLREAARKRSYQFLLQAQGNQIPLVDEAFASVISNSVLEHIPDIQPVLSEIARVLRPGAPFFFCVPNHNFLPSLSVAKFLDKVRLGVLGVAYRNFFNRISRHHHCDPPEVWIDRLENAGFRIDRWWHYFSPRMLHVMEMGHYFGLPSMVVRWITGRWVLFPSRENLAITSRFIRPYFELDPVCADGVYTFYITRKG